MKNLKNNFCKNYFYFGFSGIQTITFLVFFAKKMNEKKEQKNLKKL